MSRGLHASLEYSEPFGWDCINTCQRKGLSGAGLSPARPFSRPVLVQTAAKARGSSPPALEFSAETDSPLEEVGFELVWGFSCQVVVFGL
jgi:hypothetical protein